MPRQQTVIAGGAAVALAALGYRAWGRGVFAGATGSAYTPWDDWGGNDLDGTRRPLRAATLAASPHNTQPWLFDVTGDAIDVYADRARHLGSFDPFRREMHLGLGCAIENLVRATRVFGFAADVQPANGRLELAPGPQPVLAAHIAVTAVRPGHDPLFEAIPKRHTNRGPYREEPIAPERLQELTDLVSTPPVRLALLVARQLSGLMWVPRPPHVRHERDEPRMGSQCVDERVIHDHVERPAVGCTFQAIHRTVRFAGACMDRRQPKRVDVATLGVPLGRSGSVGCAITAVTACRKASRRRKGHRTPKSSRKPAKVWNFLHATRGFSSRIARPAATASPQVPERAVSALGATSR